MKRIYRILSVAALVCAPMVAYAQNIDPTVVVDRAYEGKLMEVHKPSAEMAVPDSVMRFDLDFDYSVFDSPYKGSYEFSPYLLSMKPSSAVDKEGRFYLKAGAGYQFHPTMDLVWSPDLKDSQNGFSMDVYAQHRSFIGNYWDMEGDSDLVIDRGEGVWSGYDMRSKAGVDMRYDWKKGVARLDAGYIGMHQKDMDWVRGYNGVEADFGLVSKGVSRFDYVVDAKYRFAGDRTISLLDDSKMRLNESNFEVNASAETGFKENCRLSLDMGLKVDGYGGAVENAASELYITPHFEYEKGILYADLGLKFSAVIVDTLAKGFSMPASNQVVYPDVTVRLRVIPDALSFVFNAGGGTEIHSYNSLLQRNPHLNSLYCNFNRFTGLTFGQGMGISVERVRLTAGLEGRVGSRFSWNMTAGYSNYASGILDAAAVWQINNVRGIYSGVDYRPYDRAFVRVGWLWKSSSFMADGRIEYTDTFGDAFNESMFCIKPAALTGDVSFEYNYRRRVFAGVDCSFSTARTGDLYSVTIPGYADLGLSAEYAATRSLSFWVRGGNLLGMTIQRNPVYAEKGAYFTAGICLNF